jgi:cysteinyl-tRNA synthetase
MVTIDGVKMGKSLGNSLTIQQAISGDHAKLSQGYPPLAIRFFILSSHYRQNTDFTDEALKSAARGHERLLGTVALVRQKLAKAEASRFRDARRGEAEAKITLVLLALASAFLCLIGLGTTNGRIAITPARISTQFDRSE